MTRLNAFGLLAGTAVAVLVLVVLSIVLLNTPHASVRILVAVWLWSLPVLGIGALGGWLVAQLVCRLTASKGPAQ